MKVYGDTINKTGERKRKERKRKSICKQFMCFKKIETVVRDAMNLKAVLLNKLTRISSHFPFFFYIFNIFYNSKRFICKTIYFEMLHLNWLWVRGCCISLSSIWTNKFMK